jgi:hypothetical protein
VVSTTVVSPAELVVGNTVVMVVTRGGEDVEEPSVGIVESTLVECIDEV